VFNALGDLDEIPDVICTARLVDATTTNKYMGQLFMSGNRSVFWKDTARVRSMVKGPWRTMDRVFNRSGVAGALPHRFRWTLASELLANGASIPQVAGILADGPITIARYYAKWTPEHQDSQDVQIRKIHGTDRGTGIQE